MRSRPSSAGIQACGRLVDDHQSRVARDRLRDAQALAHAARVRAHLALGGVGQVDAFEQLGHQRLAALRRIDALQAEQEVQHLRAAERGVEPEVLRQVAQPRPDGTRVLHDVDAVERDAAAGRLEQAGEDVHQRRLAGSVGAEQAEEALRDLERDALERSDGTGVDLDEVLDSQHGVPVA
jgi:hypothetical protein